ncbi:LysR family transcriptional regulator [Catenuloplanes sp. NPDC051500]|uniref:LysR family transcriptional regulator n=1 Tax=Catenuloplanes sp. NPDC051500 TaxID=3363959 RepID=UPI00378D8744
MELRQLEYFVAVAEEGGFTRGARRVRVAQSAVSATIQKLERELGLPLFVREAAGVTLTDAGTALLPEARGLLSAERRARDTVDQVRGGLRGTVRIGTLTSIGVRPASRGLLIVDLPLVLGRFHVTHPLVTFQLRTSRRGTAGHLEAILADELDLAMVGTSNPPDGVALHHLGAIPWCFVCPRRHRLADATSVSLADLADETFVDFPPGWGNRTMTDRAFAAAGIVRNIPFEAADQETALGLVRNGLGVTLAPRAGNEDDEGISVIDIADAGISLPIAMATAAGRDLAAAPAALLAGILRAASRQQAAQRQPDGQPAGRD